MDEGSSETVKAELSIFDSLPYQVTHVKGDWIKVDPENNCYGTNMGTPLIFEVPRSPGLAQKINSNVQSLGDKRAMENQDDKTRSAIDLSNSFVKI